MHNIQELEQRWLEYKIKSYLPYGITFVFSIVLIVTLLFIENKKTPLVKMQSEETPLKTIVSIEPKQIVQQDPIPKPVLKKELPQEKKVVLTPSMDFMKKLRTDSVNTYDSHSQQYEKVPTTPKISKPVSPKQPLKQEIKKPIYKTETYEKPKINISNKETQNDIQYVIKRFKKNNNPALSLFVAKKYYKIGNYQQAYNYALITNEINNDIEQSWIIFAKSLVKLNKKDLAIKTLSKYVKHSHSGNAKVLLDNIKSGKFQ